MEQESKMYYRDEDKWMKRLQESPFFTADEGTLAEDLFMLLNIWTFVPEQTRDFIEQENFRRDWYFGARSVNLVVIKPRCGKENAQEVTLR